MNERMNGAVVVSFFAINAVAVTAIVVGTTAAVATLLLLRVLNRNET